MPAEQHAEPPDEEWNFSRCPKSEVGVSWCYESLRDVVLRFPSEKARAIREGIETTRQNLRRPSEEETCRAMRDYLKDAPLPTLIHVGFEQWPEKAYLSIEPSERQRRLALLLCDFFPTPDPYLAKDISPYTIPPGFELKLRARIASDPERPRFIECDLVAQSDYEFELREGLKKLDTLLSNNPRYLGAVLIDPADGRTRYLRQCEAIWNSVVPKDLKFPKRKRGLGSLFAQAPSALRKMTAWRLHRAYGMSVEYSIEFLKDKLKRRAYYGDSKNFLRAVQEYEVVLKKYLR